MRYYKKIILAALVCVLLTSSTKLLKEFNWPNNKRCAVCLTYDDALNSQLDNAIPALDSFGIKGTFFCSAANGILESRASEWKIASDSGHELANHTIIHPCRKSIDGREWVSEGRDLDKYSFAKICSELKEANTLLNKIDGSKSRTFAYPCYDTETYAGSYIDTIKHLVTAARSGGVPKTMTNIDLHNLPSQSGTGMNGYLLINYVKQAEKNGTMVVFTFHGVGGDYLSVTNQAHKELLQFLSNNKDKYWVDTFKNVTDYISENN